MVYVKHNCATEFSGKGTFSIYSIQEQKRDIVLVDQSTFEVCNILPQTPAEIINTTCYLRPNLFYGLPKASRKKWIHEYCGNTIQE